jgi:hypothetical protein
MTWHARLSASSAHRWLVCAGSVGEGGPPSLDAARGTYAHSIAAACLANWKLDLHSFLGKKGTVEGFEIECDQEMVEGVQVYLDAIADDSLDGDQAWVETPLHAELSKIDPDLGGTADYIRYRPVSKHLRVYDFKYGSGVYVDAEDNAQQKIYALGALLDVLRQGLLVDAVDLTIVQPRYEGAQPVRSWAFKTIELLDFVADIKAAADKTRLPDPPLVAGSHCKFCPKARTCPELEKRQHALVAVEFSTVQPYDPAALASALAAIPLVKERIKAIEEFAYAEALAGRGVPGFKLVDKRPTRKWKSEDEVVAWAVANAIDPYAPRAVVSPAQMDERLKAGAPRGKKKEATAVLKPFYESISSGLALVPVSDDRPPVQLVSAADFPAGGYEWTTKGASPAPAPDWLLAKLGTVAPGSDIPEPEDFTLLV